ncbi:MAG TPA: EthD domain-containing protein [Chloroflexota bacterium]
MIKTIGCAIRHPTNRSLPDFQAYWAERHGPFFSHTPHLRRYVQHITMPAAYGGRPSPTHDGVSMFWYDDLDAVLRPPPSPRLIDAIPEEHTDVYDWYVRARRYGPPESMTLAETVHLDDRQLFDRSTDWPTHHRRASVVAAERVVVEGRTTPSMVKAVFMVARKPGLTIGEFQQHWLEVHGALVASLPGLRRYVQNHAIPGAYAVRPMTHDGFSELWFDDLPSLAAAAESAAWRNAAEDGQTLFAEPLGLVVAQERIQKDFSPLPPPPASSGV